MFSLFSVIQIAFIDFGVPAPESLNVYLWSSMCITGSVSVNVSVNRERGYRFSCRRAHTMNKRTG